MKVYASGRGRDSLINILKKLAGKDQWIKVRIDFNYGDYYLKVLEFIDTKNPNPMMWRFSGRTVSVNTVDDYNDRLLALHRDIITIDDFIKWVNSKND